MISRIECAGMRYTTEDKEKKMEGNVRKEIADGRCVIGIEFGSTRIKAVLIDSACNPVASGAFDWENRNLDGVWTYSIEDIKEGLRASYMALKEDVRKEYGITLEKIRAMGVSAMMHGYMAFDKDGNLLTPFRTWRNNITEAEANELTELFGHPIAQRWTISHLLKDIKEKKPYLDKLAHVSTLASYVNKLLTGEKTIGIGDASGMFPIDTATKDYAEDCIGLFDSHYASGYPWKLREVFPKVLLAGETAGYLTKEGAELLDSEGNLQAGCPLCPPEGDAETGMMATNSVAPRTGNVSAGTSVFAMVVLEKPLSKAYSSLDIVTTPDGRLVAMSHSNNCTGGYDAWFSLFGEVVEALGFSVRKPVLYDTLLAKALEGDPDCGGLLSYGYISGEHITGFSEGRPLSVRHPDAHFTLANFVRAELFTSLCAMRTGLDILFEKEGASLDMLSGHGGFFKTAAVGQRVMAAAAKTPCRVLKTAGEGGAWGIALLADYLSHKDMDLSSYLDTIVFASAESSIVAPDEKDIEGFDKFFRRYHEGLAIERAAVEHLGKE